MRSRATAALQAAFLILFASVALAHDDSSPITVIDPPHAGDQLDLWKINNVGAVVGNVFDSTVHFQRGVFILDRLLTPIDHTPNQPTVLWAINDRDVITGNAATTGFIYDQGRFTTIHKPGSAATEPHGINNHGDIAGLFSDPLFHGFLLKDGVYTAINAPQSSGTEAWDLNDRDEVVGEYSEPLPSTVTHGFLWTNGQFVTLDVPGSSLTRATGINNRGQIVGEFRDSAGKAGSFAYWRGRYATIQLSSGGPTIVKDINDFGEITGTFVDASGVGHGFTANVYSLGDAIKLVPAP